MWYQHLFQHERGKGCLKSHRIELTQMLWKEWSPGRDFRQAEFDAAAKAFDNDDFIPVVTSIIDMHLELQREPSSIKSLRRS